ncbi:MAG: sensor domain-containing diguanylate cyclase, partial [Clostridiaceae bacterium]|nr:sensor domain-containing diguanylate cyclase [Clostridiaceae bacterium]
EYAWTGNLGHWYWYIRTNAVTFNPLKAAELGYAPEEVPSPVPYQFFTERIHPDDYEHTMQAMRDHLAGQAAVYEAEYRIRAKDGSYRWYYDRGRITRRDPDGKPLFLAGIVFDVTEKKNLQLDLERKNRILAELSAIDGLTQVSNHRTIVEHLKAAMAEATRTRSPLSVALFDIDDFKHVNDSKGHIVGDQVLAAVAALIRNPIRETDQVGRYGGEEFMVVFSQVDLTTAVKAAERIRQAVAQHRFLDDLRITVSGGVSLYNGESESDLVHAADVKMYEAKRQGKNRIVF